MKFTRLERKRVVNERFPARQVVRVRVMRNDTACVELTLSCRHVVHRPRYGPMPLRVALPHDIAHCEHCPRRSCTSMSTQQLRLHLTESLR